MATRSGVANSYSKKSQSFIVALKVTGIQIRDQEMEITQVPR